MLNRMDVPFAASTFFLRWELNRAAESENVRVLLDGFGGDQTISRGLARFSELLITGHPLELAKEVKKYAKRYDKSTEWVLYRRVLTPLEPKSLHRLRQLIGTDNPVTQRSIVINETFADRIDLQSHVREVEERQRLTTRAEHRRILGGGKQADGCELSNLSATDFGIKPRFPFLDRRVMEFCFRCPGHLKFRDGWRRWLIRNALSESLPSKVRERTTKGAPGSALYKMLRSHDRDVLEELFTSDQFPSYLDQEHVQSEFERFLQGEGLNAATHVWRPAVLCRWFELTDRYE
jgi:asparagine synthase (glutamine-hydrolysing)